MIQPSSITSVMRHGLSVCAVLCCGWLMAIEPLPISASYWKDPAFQKAFNGSYRIEARIEPSITGEQRAVLVKVQELMAAEGALERAFLKIWQRAEGDKRFFQ